MHTNVEETVVDGISSPPGKTELSVDDPHFLLLQGAPVKYHGLF